MEARDKDIETLWQINGFFLLLHGAGVTFVHAKLDGLAYAFACILGLIYTVVWNIILLVMQGNIRSRNRKLARLEEQEARKHDQEMILVFQEEERTGFAGKFSINGTMIFAVTLLYIVWGMLLLYPYDPPRWQSPF